MRTQGLARSRARRRIPDIAEYRLEWPIAYSPPQCRRAPIEPKHPSKPIARSGKSTEAAPNQQRTLALRYNSLSRSWPRSGSTLRDPSRAVEFAKEAVELCPKEASVWYTWAWLTIARAIGRARSWR